MVLESATIDMSAVKNALSPVDPFDRIRKRSAAETGVLRPPRSNTTQNSPVQRTRDRGGLNLLVSPVMREPIKADPVIMSSLINNGQLNNESGDVTEISVSLCNGENTRSQSQKKKSVTFMLDSDTEPALASPTFKEPDVNQRIEDNPRYGGVVGPKGRRLKSTRSSPQLRVGTRMIDEQTDSDDEVNLLLSPDVSRSQSPPWSTQRSRSPSPCMVSRRLSHSSGASPECSNKWSKSSVFVRISHDESSGERVKEKETNNIILAREGKVRKCSDLHYLMHWILLLSYVDIACL